jgi:hypothetical protein
MTSKSAESACPAEMGSMCARRHWAVYWLIICLAVATVGSNVLSLKNSTKSGESPFFSANDRSRWCTIYSLVHFGTYEIDRVVSRKSPIHWDTIDKVMHVGSDGQMHQYSSKPALLPTLLAGEYWLIREFVGWDLDNEPIYVVRLMLLISNVIPFAVMLILLAAMLERWFVADWVRFFILGAAGFGTFLSTFCVTLNNHLPAAVSTTIALYFVDRMVRAQTLIGARSLFAAGFFAAFAAANELPALSLVVMLLAVLLTRRIGLSLIWYVVGAALVGAAFVGANAAAHGKWELAYGHRSDGEVIGDVHGDFRSALVQRVLPQEINEVCQNWIRENAAPELKAPVITSGTWMGQGEEILGRWVIRDAVSTVQFAVVENIEGNFQVREWQNWYDFPGSYWSSDRRSAVDLGEPSQLVYAFHMTLGHHGVFSLTPMFILSLAGMIVVLFDKRYQSEWLGLVTTVITIVVFAFYVSRDVHDRNYGGQTSGLRWMFWLIPFWLLTMTPVVQWLASTTLRRWICLGLLLISILSCRYSMANPWIHPWLYEFWPTLEASFSSSL